MHPSILVEPAVLQDGHLAAAATGEAYAFLVGAPVFNTGERRQPSLAGSIPVRLRDEREVQVEPTVDDVLAVVGPLPLSVGAVGVEVVRRGSQGAGALDDASLPVGQRLAAAGLSLSALQRLVDGLVADGRLVQVRGKDLWDRGLPTAGTRAMGRYYLAAGSGSS